MKCLDDCHTYELTTFKPFQPDVKPCPTAPYFHPGLIPLHFYEMREDGTKIDGVTNEEVLRVLIHRLKYLNEYWMDGKFKCEENENAIDMLQQALYWLNKRTVDRMNRGVEGRMEP